MSRIDQCSELAVMGLTYKEIAEHMGIKPQVVKNYLQKVFDREGVYSRGELIAKRWMELS